MALKFNENGKLISQVVNHPVKHDSKTKDLINELKQEAKGLIKNEHGKVEKREFYCNFHNTFHKHRYHGKPSKTYQKCLKNHFYKFKYDFTNYELFKLGFIKNWTQDKADYYKKPKSK